MAVALAGYLEVLAVYVPREAPPAFTAVVFNDPREFREYCVTGGMATHLDDGRYVVGLCIPGIVIEVLSLYIL